MKKSEEKRNLVQELISFFKALNVQKLYEAPDHKTSKDWLAEVAAILKNLDETDYKRFSDLRQHLYDSIPLTTRKHAAEQIEGFIRQKVSEYKRYDFSYLDGEVNTQDKELARQSAKGIELKELMRRAKSYVELESEAGVRVLKVTFAERFNLFGQDDIVLSVITNEKKEKEWWVVGGSTPMNLYSKLVFKSADEAFSMHTGLMLRMDDAKFSESKEEPEVIGYDAFICHASEDKEDVVRPLAKRLIEMGFNIWYDEFELKVGDSLRQSIDKGLINSRYGIIILSKAFFSKNWTKYELNGLVVKEIDGKNIILPIWHKITKADLMQYSPSLVDKVALDTTKKSIKTIADQIIEVLSS